MRLPQLHVRRRTRDRVVPVLTELFPDSHALAQHVPPTLTGMLMDAVAAGAGATATPSYRARRLATRLAGLELTAVPSIDAGAAVPLATETDHVVVRGSGMRDQIVHVTALQRHHPLLALV